MDIFSVLKFLQKLVHTDLGFDLVYEIDWIEDAYIVWGARLLDLRVYHSLAREMLMNKTYRQWNWCRVFNIPVTKVL